MLDPRAIEAVTEFHRREMKLLRSCAAADVTVAIPAALYYCIEHGLNVPRWLSIRSLRLLCDLLKREKSTKRGRSVRSVDRHHQNMIDMIRWNEVLVLREKQKLSWETVKRYANEGWAKDCPLYAEEIARARWLGKSMTRACECASECLEATEAFGSAETMKKSYLQVEKDNRDPVRALRYAQFNPLLLRMLGIQEDLGYGRHAKIAPWRPRRPKRNDGLTVARKRILAAIVRGKCVSRET